MKTEENGQRYSNLAMLLYDMAEGADSFIWNGYSTVPVHEETRMMVLDTLALLEMSESIKRTLTFLLPFKKPGIRCKFCISKNKSNISKNKSLFPSWACEKIK